jgi:hypothetical protein
MRKHTEKQANLQEQAAKNVIGGRKFASAG